MFIFYFLVVLSLFTAGFVEEANLEDKTLSPYFFIQSDDPSVDQLPLKSTSAEVNIAGVIADVTVKQVYKNEGQSTLEAIYVFPASTRAAVYSMTMTIGERTIAAEIKEKEEARAEYEQAKSEGRSASLLEQDRPNVFTMNVANILPEDEITVELRYTELLVPSEGTYEFAYPTVVGPRYSNKESAEEFNANPYTQEGEAPLYDFDISVEINGGVPLQNVEVTTHKAKITNISKTQTHIDLAKSESDGGNRDFILQYQLAGEAIESGLLLYEGEEENFFLLISQPPKAVKVEQIPAREYLFIVDISGSMHGFPLDTTKVLLKDLLADLKETDRFNILLFAGGSSVLARESLPATPRNLKRAVAMLDGMQAGGSTELLPALQRAFEMPYDKDASRIIAIITDGYVTVEKEAFDLVRESLNNANVFSFGIGSSINRFLIEGLARIGQGEPFVLTSPEKSEEEAKRFSNYIASPVLTNIEVNFEGFEVYDVEPPSIPDVLAQRPVIVYGKWRGEPAGTITITGQSGKGDYEAVFNVADSQPLVENSALRYLWARNRIALLGDYQQVGGDEKAAITTLGLKYNLLTDYTSFIAVDNLVRADGEVETVRQPLPLPEGVSNQALPAQAMGRTMSFNSIAAPPQPQIATGAPPPAPVRPQSGAYGPTTSMPYVATEEFDEAEPANETTINLPKAIIPETKVKETGLGNKIALSNIQTEQYEMTSALYSFLQQDEAKKQLAVCFNSDMPWLQLNFILTLDELGKITNLSVDSLVGDDLEEQVKSCIANQIQTWTYPAIGEASFTLTFSL